MDTFDAIYQRRAVKHFDPEHRLAQGEETKLLEAAIQAPTSFNIQHCDIDGVAKLIGLPDDHVLGPMVAIGKGAKKPSPKPGQLRLSEFVIENRFD